jgi:hypothetical protein
MPAPITHDADDTVRIPSASVFIVDGTVPDTCGEASAGSVGRFDWMFKVTIPDMLGAAVVVVAAEGTDDAEEPLPAATVVVGAEVAVVVVEVLAIVTTLSR